MSVLAAYRGLLRNGPLVRLLGGEFVSSIGDWLYLVALLVLVYQASSDPVLLGVVGAARVLPYVLLSIPAGIVADRFDRRLVLLVTDVARGLIMLVMAVLQASHGPLVAIVALAILATCFSTFFGPTIGSYLPSLVKDETQLGPANSAWSSLDNLAFVIGPAIAGLLIAIGGLTAAFVLNAASFAVIAVVLWQLPSVSPAEPTGGADGPPAPDAGSGPAPSLPSPMPTPSPLRVPLPLPLRPLAGLALIDVAAGFAIGGIGILTVVLATRQLGAGRGRHRLPERGDRRRRPARGDRLGPGRGPQPADPAPDRRDRDLCPGPARAGLVDGPERRLRDARRSRRRAAS